MKNNNIQSTAFFKDLIFQLVLRGYTIKLSVDSNIDDNESAKITATNDPFRIHLYCEHGNAIIEIYKISKSYNQLDFTMDLLIKSTITEKMIPHILFMLTFDRYSYVNNNSLYDYQLYFKQAFANITAQVLDDCDLEETENYKFKFAYHSPNCEDNDNF